ncbi:Acyltransferase 3 [Frankia canadensis]|uniref:Acyltransferase 3 n=1 Tax=Frankia canadensis TaxID=1836972 RepID=A0A2I2KK76_9ACTN|nr:acyltransferase [Frankia canadensis]SNQ46063.1 Acyltransferase 3 [Frankia canadensis]SOU53353.1 Acyltransferase 3 [Frankia canadensis]
MTGTAATGTTTAGASQAATTGIGMTEAVPAGRAGPVAGTADGTRRPSGRHRLNARRGASPRAARNLPALTGLRGVATALVFLRHIHTDVGDTLPVAALGNIGYAGVTFFFLLSGFVLTWAAGPDTRLRFYWRRLARIYPLYLVAIGLWLAVAWPLGMIGRFGSQPVAILPSLLLVQAWIPTQTIYFGWGGAVLWSLSCEAFFYLVFPLLHPRLAARDNAGRIRVALFAVLPTAAVACVAGAIDPRVDLAAYASPAVRLGEFVLGIVLGLLARDGVRGRPGQRRALGVFAVGWLAVPIALGYDYGDRQGLIDTLALPSFAAIIFLVGTREADGRRLPAASARPLVAFGVLSYAFYLVHPVALTLGGRLGWFDATTAPVAALGVLAGFLLALALAAVLHHTVERPAHRYLLRRLPAARAAGTA